VQAKPKPRFRLRFLAASFLLVCLMFVAVTQVRAFSDARKLAAEQRRVEEQQRLAEEARLAEEVRRAEEERLRAEAEERRRAELGDLYIPLPPAVLPDNPPVKAKGLYITGNIAGLASRFNHLLALVENSGLNSLVIDVKDDNGLMTYRSDIAMAAAVGANRYVRIKDVGALLAVLKEKEIYPIARIVAFKDPNLSSHRADLSIQRKSGGVWKDKDGISWVNPFDRKVWDYNIAIAKEAALNGFREIQFDYVRFPDNAKRVNAEAAFPQQNDRTKAQAVAEFLAYAREELAPYGVFVSADVFGVIATSPGDTDDIGQEWEAISAATDYICPMVYPSHYGRGYFGYAVPDAHPHGTVHNAITDALERNEPLPRKAIIRPWLQDFTAVKWVDGAIPYGKTEVEAQIRALAELGVEEFLLWNASNKYTESVWQ
jgi:hypothetical protein